MIGLLFAAALDPARKDDPKIWGPKGYFLTENGEHVWGDLASQIGQEVYKQGFIKTEPEVREWSIDEAIASPAGFEAASWGTNSRGTAIRSKKNSRVEPGA